MSLMEKIIILGSLGGMGLTSVYFIWRSTWGSSYTTNAEILATRNRIISSKEVRILFSTMSFFYLHGFNPKSFDSLVMLYDIFRVASPNYVALQLSQKELAREYTPVLTHPRFPELMDKVELGLKLKNPEIAKIEGVDDTMLGNLYSLDYCAKKKCKILLCGREPAETERIYQARLSIEETKKPGGFLADIGPSRTERNPEEIYREVFYEELEGLFVETIMKEIAPKFSLVPDVPYKTIVGVAKSENIEGIAKKWKEKFKATYGHTILEDTQIPKKETQEILEERTPEKATQEILEERTPLKETQEIFEERMPKKETQEIKENSSN